MQPFEPAAPPLYNNTGKLAEAAENGLAAAAGKEA